MNKRSLGNLFIVAAPSGGGKTSLVNELVHRVKNLVVSISHTTRDQRPGEIDGKHYFFIKEKQFISMIDQGKFVEHARVFDHYYGTSHAEIDARLKQGMDVILDIDWQGAAQIKQFFNQAVSVFILPPSLDILEQRLINRQRDNTDIIQKRMQRAQSEMSHYQEFDYLIVNDDFEKAFAQLSSIITSYRLKTKRQVSSLRKLLSLLLTSQ
jgi:guanylate kinase